jgi:hypothetical protein
MTKRCESSRFTNLPMVDQDDLYWSCSAIGFNELPEPREMSSRFREISNPAGERLAFT